MTGPSFTTLAVGDALEPVVRGPITRGTLALFAGASNDHVLLHIDSDYAKAAGMGDVFAHGMLVMAYLGQMLPHDRLRHWQVRFTAITPLYATIRCEGVVEAIVEEDGERRARIAISATTDTGLTVVAGHAVLALD